MWRIGEEIHLDADEARGGTTLNVVRYVLLTSLVLAVLAMSAIWIGRALSDRPAHEPVTAEEHALGG